MDAEAIFHRLDNLSGQPISFTTQNLPSELYIRPFYRFFVTYVLLKFMFNLLETFKSWFMSTYAL